MKTPDYYPVEARVVLKGLSKAPELNGKVGIVKSGLTNGRQHVLVEELHKSVALKVSNLSFEPRAVESLSVKELKNILQSQTNISDSELTGIDKSELQSKVSALNEASPETIGQWLAEAAPKSYAEATKASTGSSSSSTGSAAAAMNSSLDPAQAAGQLASMNPEQLRQQARMMRSMPPDQIRRMNPQLANMTDSQIIAAANQMEMMASNPAMMKMATEQIKNMSPEEVQRMQSQAVAGNGGGVPASQSTASNNTSNSGANRSSLAPTTGTPATQAAEMMANMSPEQLRQQADMFESLSPDEVRRMNPQVANMTDEQIKMAANQFRMMADNPAMMKMAMDQMKNMTPEQIEAIRNGTGPKPSFDPSNMSADPAKMLGSMDKDQLKNMLKTLKDNPDMLKQFAASSGVGEEQLSKGLEMFAEMDDSKLDMAVNLMQKAQKAKNVWNSANEKAGGHLMKIIVMGAILFVGLLVHWFLSKNSGMTPATPTIPDEIPNMAAKEEAVMEDEFASEF